MCLYPKLIRNKKYIPNQKNGGNPPPVKDPRTKSVPIGCQKCIECRKQKSREWQVRLLEEVRHNNKAEFVTLTFSDESISKLTTEVWIEETIMPNGYELDNAIATMAVRRFTERWRKRTSKAPRHWLITELGHNGTENIHLHGIIWTTEKEQISNTWQYGYVFVGDYVNEATVNYIIKYVTKTDIKHKEYNPKILASKGIGKNYLNRPDSKLNAYNKGETKETYTTRDGLKLNLPIYYRNKLYTEEEKEKLWIEKLDKMERWVLGTRIDTSKGFDEYQKAVGHARNKNKRLGYGDDEKNHDRKEYENQIREQMMQTRLQRAKLKTDYDKGEHVTAQD